MIQFVQHQNTVKREKEENEKALLKTKSELDSWSNDMEQKIN